jgi:hypothetical protein
MFANKMQVVTIVGEGSAIGSDNPIPIGINGAAPAPSIPVPDGKKLVLTDMLGSTSANPCEFVVQQSRDGGATWFNVMLARSAGQDSKFIGFVTPRVIRGGPQVLIQVLNNSGAGQVSITLIGWLEDAASGQGILSGEFIQPCATGRVLTLGVAEQTLPIGVDFIAPASAVNIPLGVTWNITDWVVCASAGTIFRIQESDDGGITWYDRVIARVPGFGPSEDFGFETPISIVGGAEVQMRLRVTTPNGAADVDVTLGVSQQPSGVAVVPIP